MKKIFILISILSLLLVSNISQSQVSGFMGKKNILKLGLFLKSSFVMPNKNGESGYFSFNDRYSIEFERVITRNKSIQLRATTFETLYKTLSGTYGYSDDNADPLLKMSCKDFGADFIIYKSSHIAPLGVYGSFGFDVIISTVDVDTAILNNAFQTYNDYGSSFPRYSNTQFTTTHFGLNMKSGVKQIFFNCLSIDFNFQLGVIFSGDVTNETKFENDYDKYLRNRIGNRLWGHYLWGVNCSVGYLF
ncbi:MAG: hypothetical protein HXX18_02745 [Bacteroidetes bacterium]|nr:hypothetical protein [Bacteroidota bacterium]